MRLFRGNNIECLKKLKDNSIDSIVTDPHYGLKFMGKKIEGCRIGDDIITQHQKNMKAYHSNNLVGGVHHGKVKSNGVKTTTQGRWPANVILDEEAGKLLDEQSESASRFFYCAKASKKERGEGNIHPTVKPIKLMEYLIKLVTPPNGTVLDPFMGSGSTGIAAKNLGFNFVGMELSKEYFEIAKRRIENT